MEDWLEDAVIEEPEVATQETVEGTGAEVTRDAAETPAQPAEKPAPDMEGIKAALLAERRKRQEIEQQLAAKMEEEKPFLGEEYEQRFTETERKFQQQLINQKLDMSEAFARDKYADFGDKIVIFEAMVQENPALYQQMLAQANPADFAYKTATNQQKLQEMGDPTAYEQKLREKITAEIEAKYATKGAAEHQKRAELPGTLATVSGAGGATAQTWSGPTSLDDLLK